MLRRQRVLLAVLARASGPIGRTPFVKLAFLLSRETDIPDRLPFYDFLPYRYGPFSFVLYRELGALLAAGHIRGERGGLVASPTGVAHCWRQEEEAADPVLQSVDHVLGRYGGLSRASLVDYVHQHYPWYASRSDPGSCPRASSAPRRLVEPRVYTIGYAGRSVDALFDGLLRTGIEVIADVRANPLSRKYGLSKGKLSQIAARLDMGYIHVGALGIPSARRRESGPGGRVALLDEYEQEFLPRHMGDVSVLAAIFRRRPSVLLCAEANPEECHRTRLANALSAQTGLAAKVL